ncbi:MAG: hypothetical protein JW941_11855 [Candidatus Coatesbacteria bacterium]|nr:hypothetical protein [Candidatus Coatesbacteria bacterium]
MPTYCEFCHRPVRDMKKMVEDTGFIYCSEDCHSRAVVLFEEDVRESIRRSRIEKFLLGAEEEAQPGYPTLPKGDVSRTTMIIAALYERRGEFRKAMTCWKKIALLHRGNLALRKRAMCRIKDLKIKCSVKCHPEVGK